MLRNLCLIALISTVFFTNAQKIISDEIVDIQGREVRMVNASSETFRSFTDRVVLSLNLMATQAVGEQKPRYSLYVSLNSSAPISAPARARILIKTKDGEVIELKEAGNIPKEDITGELKMAGGITYKSFTIGLVYNLTPEEISQIATGVTKVRIETNGENPYQKEWKKDKIGRFIQQEYELISSVLSKTPDKRSSFGDDF